MEIELIKVDRSQFRSASDVYEFCIEECISITKLHESKCLHEDYKYIYFDVINDSALLLSDDIRFDILNDRLNRSSHFFDYLTNPTVLKKV